MAKPIVLQAGFFASLGLGAYVLRRLSTPVTHPTVAEACPRLPVEFPALAAALSQLATLGDDTALRALVEKVARVVELDSANGPASQWKISRLNTEILKDARAMCRAAPSARSDEVFRAVLDCESEALPQIEGQLEILLHNHLLARSPMG